MAEAKAELDKAFKSRNMAAFTRAVQAEKAALALTPTIECFKCGVEFEQGDELIICAVGILRKRKDAEGNVVTNWLAERDVSTPVNLPFCPDCDDELNIDSVIGT
jgi:hypothetical protein